MKYQRRGRKALTMLFAACLMLGGAALTGCSSEDDPYFTVSENDDPRILNTDLADQTLDRKTNLTIEIKVTPIQYTTVTWLLNDVQIAEGMIFDQTLPVGNHVLKIVATTTKGKSTSRTIKVTVTPAEGDPVLASDAKSRWLTIGTTKTIACENVTSISKLYVGDVQASNVSYADNQITFDVPVMPEGEYMVFIEDAAGTRYGCGLFTVSKEKYVDPGIKETVLWEGDQAIDWNADLCKITADQLADIPVGTEIHVYYTTPEAEYHAMRITSPWWGDTPEDDFVTQFDITAETPNPFVFVYDEHAKALVDERGAICLVGFGYTVQKIVAVEGVAPAEKTLWEGDVTIDWNADLCKIATEEMADVPVGATINVYYELVEAEYHAMRITSPWWGDTPEDDFVTQFDITEETPNPFGFAYDEHAKALVDERGAICLVGFGYKVTKITYTE